MFVNNIYLTMTSASTTPKTIQPQQPELLLTPDENRFVMFPLQSQAIWDMYKKQVDCFWRAEEVDLSKDKHLGKIDK